MAYTEQMDTVGGAATRYDDRDYQTMLKVADDFIMKNYVGSLSDMEILPLDEEFLENNLEDNVRFFKINKMVYEKNEFATYKFAGVFNSLAASDCTIFLIIDGKENGTDFYMGIRRTNKNSTTYSFMKTVENALLGQFPGAETHECDSAEISKVISGIKTESISSVSGVADSKSEHINQNKNFVQGLEKLVLSMQGQRYTGVIIANTVSHNELRSLRKDYETIYTSLSPYAANQINRGVNQSFNESLARNLTSSRTLTDTHQESVGKGGSEATTNTKAHTVSTSMTVGMSTSMFFGVGVGFVNGGTAQGINSSITTGRSNTTSESKTESTNWNKTTTEGYSAAIGESEGTTETYGQTSGTSENVTVTVHNKMIESMLERIDKQLKRLDEGESMGAYECAAYFMSDDRYTAEIAASTYKSLMCGEKTGVEMSAVNSWRNSNGDDDESRNQRYRINRLREYMTNFVHPVFKYTISGRKYIPVTPSSIVSGNELALHMGLPRHSVCGLPVIEHADFGKEIAQYGSDSAEQGIKLGSIYNMGQVYNNIDVKLSAESLSMHTFVTGSTGSGKSNTIYEILNQLSKNRDEEHKVRFMVIEPIKGEYKQIFGKRARVFGTNPQHTELLKINPFRFPKNIHVLEHVDRLVEIFNVCWPMYAAMPAVLKDAMLDAYEECGWDMVNSSNKYGELFPMFSDLLKSLEKVIESSEYSSDTKSDYKGSLITRVKSLTNGLNGQLFAADEISDETLFNDNVIVDLSRVGSLETKSLIMGILVMRLSEYRMTEDVGMNSRLRHVTVLEEAHNILKRTSAEQTDESSNITGKSVEMISNAIAEMRTYGEGFIIADQSPGAVDISAIRNTNTKIILRLPEEQDRRASGKSAALKDEQLEEIARLPRGVAAVYQNDWIEPVLCMVNEYAGEHDGYSKPEHDDAEDMEDDDMSYEIKNIILRDEITKYKEGFKKRLMKANISTRIKKLVIEYIDSDHDKTILSELACSFFNSSELIRLSTLCGTIEDWQQLAMKSVKPSVEDCSEIEIKNLLLLILFGKSSENVENRNVFAGYLEYLNKSERGVA